MTPVLVKQPIYQQLNEALRALLASGELREGQRFLTEREICARFEVSRPTANKALSNLVSEGILEFKKGVGTFVRGVVLEHDLRALVSFTGKAVASGKRPSTQVLEFRTHRAGQVAKRIRLELRLADDAGVHFMARLRSVDGRPVILERRWVPADLCPGLTRAELAGSLYSLWIRRFGLRVDGASQTLRAVVLRGEDAKLLRSTRGAAALQVTAVGALHGGRPLWWERTLYRGDRYAFRNSLGALQAARPASGAYHGPDDEDCS
jgi:GntR family transcriptional regulator